MKLELEIKKFCEIIGLDVVGITSVDQLEIQLDTDTMGIDITSVISVAECYLTSEVYVSSDKQPLGKVARFTWRNYYHDVKMKLRKLSKFLRKKKNAKCKYYSCGYIPEKPIAVSAGIGWYGKNTIIQTEKFGSWVVLGELLTDVELEPDERIERDCGSCNICVRACPTHAIEQPYMLTKEKCLQYLSHWYGILPKNIREIWGDRLYGCTTCQDVCPNNKNVLPINRKLSYGYVGPALPLIPILQMSENEYRTLYRHNQISARWVPFESIQRNAVTALGNIGVRTAVSVLTNILKHHPSYVVRAHTVWALSKLCAYESIRDAYRTENNIAVLTEIESAIYDSKR